LTSCKSSKYSQRGCSPDRREDRRPSWAGRPHRGRNSHHASLLAFAVYGTVAGLIDLGFLSDFGEQVALVSNHQVIYALRPEARNRLNTIFLGGMFVGGATGSDIGALVYCVAQERGKRCDRLQRSGREGHMGRQAFIAGTAVTAALSLG